MKLSLIREALVKALQALIGVVEKRHTMAILANILFKVEAGKLVLIATDTEIELITTLDLDHSPDEAEAITIPARKLLDIVRSLPEASQVNIAVGKNNRIAIQAGNSRFHLMGLPAQDFPLTAHKAGRQTFTLTQHDFLFLLKRTAFAMAQQDVRYFLNGLLLEVDEAFVQAVATDGHRLALTKQMLTTHCQHQQVIIPRKAVLELLRLLQDDQEAQVSVTLADNYIRVTLPNITFTSKLLDGRYPDYKRVIPPANSNQLVANTIQLKQALSRTAILSNEKFRGVRMQLQENQLCLSANNPEHEEAQDDLAVAYEGQLLEVGFNVNYLLDVMQVIDQEDVSISLASTNSSALIQAVGDESSLYVVMPIRL